MILNSIANVYMLVSIFLKIKETFQYDIKKFDFPQGLESINQNINRKNKFETKDFFNYDFLKDGNIITWIEEIINLSDDSSLNSLLPNLTKSCVDKFKIFTEALRKKEEWSYYG
jgi:hypothetical protein